VQRNGDAKQSSTRRVWSRKLWLRSVDSADAQAQIFTTATDGGKPAVKGRSAVAPGKVIPQCVLRLKEKSIAAAQGTSRKLSI